MEKSIITDLEESILSAGFDCKTFFDEINHKYHHKEKIELFRYILLNKTDEKLLDSVIRKINAEKLRENLADLIDFIVRPIDENQ